MAQAPARPRRLRPSLWRQPFLVGVCLALGYGITQRLVAMGLPSLVQLGQGFDSRPFPGTSLDSLRQRFGLGAEGQQIRGDLDLQELEQQDPQTPKPPEQDPMGAESAPPPMAAAEAPAPPVAAPVRPRPRPRPAGALLEPPAPPQLPPPELP